MRRCHARYTSGEWRTHRPSLSVLDVGGADVNGGYRPIFEGEGVLYSTADLEPGQGVDIVLEDPYVIPAADGTYDIVLSGQMLEHCEFFWLSFAEMMRVLKPDGFLFLIAPSAGPIHNYPVDCYRFYPDAYRALAKHAGCHLVECWLDERGPWRDLVGVFSHQEVEPSLSKALAYEVTAPTAVAGGTEEEEQTSGTMPYHELLSAVHRELAPRRYLEIGVRKGGSLRLASCDVIAIDPEPDIQGALREGIELYRMSSDCFFDDPTLRESATGPDLAFIDGMHLFEFALRDFMNIERLSHSGTMVVIDDIYPSHPRQASRERQTRVWTGDIWKLYQCLLESRKDLVLVPVDASPTGLLIVAGLDARNRALWTHYNPIVRRYAQPIDPPLEILDRSSAWSPDDPRLTGLMVALREARMQRRNPGQVAQQLRTVIGSHP